MKRFLLLLPLLVCSCTNQPRQRESSAKESTIEIARKVETSSIVNSSSEIESKLFQNVYYEFVFDKRQYEIVVERTDHYFVDLENVHYVYSSSYYRTNDGGILENEFYTNPNRLFIYTLKWQSRNYKKIIGKDNLLGKSILGGNPLNGKGFGQRFGI